MHFILTWYVYHTKWLHTLGMKWQGVHFILTWYVYHTKGLRTLGMKHGNHGISYAHRAAK